MQHPWIYRESWYLCLPICAFPILTDAWIDRDTWDRMLVIATVDPPHSSDFIDRVRMVLPTRRDGQGPFFPKRNGPFPTNASDTPIWWVPQGCHCTMVLRTPLHHPCVVLDWNHGTHEYQDGTTRLSSIFVFPEICSKTICRPFAWSNSGFAIQHGYRHYPLIMTNIAMENGDL